MGTILSVAGGCIGSCAASCAAYCACEACKTCTKGLERASRIGYTLLFTMSIFLAWLLRDYAQPMLKKIPWINEMGLHPSDEWFGKQAVYRVSMGNFAFFSLFALLLIGVKYKGDARGRLHHGGWFLKICAWLSFNIIPFFLPNSVAEGYSWFARFGSGIFLVMQMLILLDFTHVWNDAWVSKEHVGWVASLLVLTVSAYGLGIAGIVIMYKFFDPASAGGCGLNVTFITITLVLAVVFSVVSLLPQIKNGSLFPSAMIALYCVFLCFSALASEPNDYECNSMGNRMDSSNQWIGMMITLIAVVYSAMRVGSSADTFSLESTPARQNSTPLVIAPGTQGMSKDEESGAAPEDNHDEFDPVDYNYTFFHLIFALASMYVAMIMTSWASSAPSEQKDTADVGWASVWVKIVSQWAMSLMYLWTLLAPVVLRDRDFGV